MSTTSTLILGGARSGKSRLAEQLATRSARPVTYLATATVSDDDEMRTRIDTHRARRPAGWHTVEEPLALASCLRAHSHTAGVVIVDCLTLWLSNLLCAEDETQLRSEREALIDALASLPGRVILVSNETGLGVVPMGALSRRFVDESGDLHRRLAEVCDQVIFTVACLPQVLKGERL